MAHTLLVERLLKQAEKYGSRAALKERDNQTGKWRDISWRKLSEKVMLTAKAIMEFGIEAQENVGVYSPNMPQSIYTDYGAYANRVVIVPMYATSSPAQISYIIKDAAISTLFVGEQVQYNNAYIVSKEVEMLKRIIVFDSSVKLNPEDKTSIYFDDFLKLGDNAHAESKLKIRMNEATIEDIATIMYTSGTTGESKGVILTHANFAEAMRIHTIRLPKLTDKDVSMCFLPLSHIFEKAWAAYCIEKGTTIAVNQDPKNILNTLAEVRPTVMCNVPRFWEKVYVGVLDKINNSSPFMQKVFHSAIQAGRDHNIKYLNKGLKPPFMLRIKYAFYDMTVFTLLKKVLGLNKGQMFPVAGAPLSVDIYEFMKSVNIPILYGYGLSETTATVCFCPETQFTLGSIGIVMPDVDVKIDPANDEILIKGKTVTPGYYKKPEENAKSFTADGYFRSGDAGWLEGDTLFFKERIKDLYKTSNGKYIAPQAIEIKMSTDHYIEQIAVIGDTRKFVSAVIVPNMAAIEELAKKRNITFESKTDLLANPEIYRFIDSRIEELQKDLSSYEKIKRFVLTPEPFSIEGGELTNTFKLKRAVILQKYGQQIEEMYIEENPVDYNSLSLP